ncbi:MAG: ribose-5-phosphate isomerase RpiA [Candidatus Heimdallarchaeota archaeon]|nr:ribose-5-phosphate isomerase RpiA [Candidatus Heimdallarchaeota archaeon]MCK4877402.1 ribose-5-phosphate isomerase RpiA [Candidatus Heimdallarchaeota archaeon]
MTDTYNSLPQKEKAKALAAKKALEDFVFDDFIVGIGTGSTIKYFIKALSELVVQDELEIITVPSSFETHLELARSGLPVSTLVEFPELDTYVDSADIVTGDYVLIKGGGGALTMEKIMAKAAKEFIVIIDNSKYPQDLLSHPVPIEILPLAVNTVVEPIYNLGGEFKLRYEKGKIGPVISDNGNVLGDINFNQYYNPKEIEMALNSISGVIENGIFTLDIHRLIIGQPNSVKVIDRPSSQSKKEQ